MFLGQIQNTQSENIYFSKLIYFFIENMFILGGRSFCYIRQAYYQEFKQKFLGNPHRSNDLEIAKEILLSYNNHQDIEHVL
jgi:hypothetical protein